MNVMAAHYLLFLVIMSRFYSGFCTEMESYMKTTSPNVVAQIGSNVTLKCFAYHWYVHRSSTFVQWKLNGREISDTERIKLHEDYYRSFGEFTLRIVNVTTSDAGVYTCAAHFIDIVLRPVRMKLAVNTAEPKIFSRKHKTDNFSLPGARNMSARSQAKLSSATTITYKLVTPTINQLQTDKTLGNTTATMRLNTKQMISKMTYSTAKVKVVAPILGATLGALATACIVFVVRKRTRKGSRQGFSIEECKEYKYDVFVTYRSKDSEIWVKETLLPLLDENNLKYCVHDIHWEPGRYVYEQMAESVYQSRMVLVLLSKNYMKSNYCKEELYYAIYRNVEKGDRSLIVVKFDDMNVKEIPREIRNRTFIDTSWKTWREKLVRALEGHIKTKEETISDV